MSDTCVGISTCCSKKNDTQCIMSHDIYHNLYLLSFDVRLVYTDSFTSPLLSGVYIDFSPAAIRWKLLKQ